MVPCVFVKRLRFSLFLEKTAALKTTTASRNPPLFVGRGCNRLLPGHPGQNRYYSRPATLYSDPTIPSACFASFFFVEGVASDIKQHVGENKSGFSSASARSGVCSTKVETCCSFLSRKPPPVTIVTVALSFLYVVVPAGWRRFHDYAPSDGEGGNPPSLDVALLGLAALAPGVIHAR